LYFNACQKPPIDGPAELLRGRARGIVPILEHHGLSARGQVELAEASDAGQPEYRPRHPRLGERKCILDTLNEHQDCGIFCRLGNRDTERRLPGPFFVEEEQPPFRLDGALVSSRGEVPELHSDSRTIRCREDSDDGAFSGPGVLKPANARRIGRREAAAA
jgi:hypothetical protein